MLAYLEQLGIDQLPIPDSGRLPSIYRLADKSKWMDLLDIRGDAARILEQMEEAGQSFFVVTGLPRDEVDAVGAGLQYIGPNASNNWHFHDEGTYVALIFSGIGQRGQFEGVRISDAECVTQDTFSRHQLVALLNNNPSLEKSKAILNSRVVVPWQKLNENEETATVLFMLEGRSIHRGTPSPADGQSLAYIHY